MDHVRSINEFNVHHKRRKRNKNVKDLIIGSATLSQYISQLCSINQLHVHAKKEGEKK